MKDYWYFIIAWIAGMFIGVCMMLCIAENEDPIIVTTPYEDLEYCIEIQVFGDDGVLLYCKEKKGVKNEI